MPEVMKTLFLNPPSYEGFDGGAGAQRLDPLPEAVTAGQEPYLIVGAMAGG